MNIVQVIVIFIFGMIAGILLGIVIGYNPKKIKKERDDEIIDLLDAYLENSPIEYTAEEIIMEIQSKIREIEENEEEK